MDKWEYTVELVSDGALTGLLGRSGLENTLNNAGRDGWDLVSTIPTGSDLLVIMKRLKD